ncbi:MAG TPA: hypothetical protein VMU13_03485 [Candidatus Paceibacterota bacterium]|nr:hypothetical protein [Candidatus Paceibacterota bacterium]
MINSLLHSKLVIVLIIIVVLGAGWYGLTSSSTAPSGPLTGTAPDTSGDQAIVSNLLSLQSISLSGTIFSDPAYATLQSYTTAIVSVPVGRPDPFAPLSTQATQASAAPQSGTASKPAN